MHFFFVFSIVSDKNKLIDELKSASLLGNVSNLSLFSTCCMLSIHVEQKELKHIYVHCHAIINDKNASSVVCQPDCKMQTNSHGVVCT